MLKIFFLAFLALQGTYARDIQMSVQENSTRDLQQELEKILAEIREAVSSAIREIVEIGKNIYEQLGEEIQAILREAAAAMKKVVDEALAKLEEIQQNAAAIGQEIGECVDGERANILALTQKTQADIQVCVSTAQKEAQALIETALAVVQNIQGQVTGLINEWNACTNVICRVGVLTKLTSLVGEIRGQVEVIAQDFVNFFRTTIPNLQNCAAAAVQAHNAGMREIMGRVQECVNNIGN